MATQPRPASDDSVIQSPLFSLTRSSGSTFQHPALVLQPEFPWIESFPGEKPWSDCPQFMPIRALVDTQIPTIMLEDFEGESLAALMKSRTLSPEQSFEILHQLASALDHLHALGRIHGALTPSSVLIGEAASVRVVDWMIDWNQVPLQHLSPIADQLSPERLSNIVPGPHADQFTLGSIAHQLLTGRSPFPGAGLAEKLFCIRFGLFDHGILNSAGFATQVVYERVFSVNPDHRFNSCSAFVDELEKSSSQRYYGETRLIEVEEDAASPEFPAEDDPDAEDTVASSGPSLHGWWLTAAILAIVALALGIFNWRLQSQIDTIEAQAAQVAPGQFASSSLSNGTFQVCNASPEPLDVRELAVAYWDQDHKLRVFSSDAYTRDGWMVLPASSESLSWPAGQTSIWDGSVLFYFVRVQQGQKEFVVSGRWDSSKRDCLHLGS